MRFRCAQDLWRRHTGAARADLCSLRDGWFHARRIHGRCWIAFTIGWVSLLWLALMPLSLLAMVGAFCRGIQPRGMGS